MGAPAIVTPPTPREPLETSTSYRSSLAIPFRSMRLPEQVDPSTTLRVRRNDRAPPWPPAHAHAKLLDAGELHFSIRRHPQPVGDIGSFARR